MKKRKRFLRFTLLSIGALIILASGCEKNDDINEQNVPVLSTTDVTEITPNTATSGGNITNDGGTTVTARGVCWSTSDNPSIDDDKTEDGTGTGIFMSSITNLEPNTTYYIRAYATNSAGIGYGNSMSFTTIEETTSGTFTDARDGNVYNWVQIGDQIWMAENLNYDASGSYIYDNNPSNASTYGRLYNWEEARIVCPSGWHLPSDNEWKQLEMVLGMSQADADDQGWRGTNEGSKLAGIADLWIDGALEIDEDFGTSGFTALPGGYRDHSIFNYHRINEYGHWWSASDYQSAPEIYAFDRAMSSDYTTVWRQRSPKAACFSVRCVKD